MLLPPEGITVTENSLRFQSDEEHQTPIDLTRDDFVSFKLLDHSILLKGFRKVKLAAEKYATYEDFSCSLENPSRSVRDAWTNQFLQFSQKCKKMQVSHTYYV